MPSGTKATTRTYPTGIHSSWPGFPCLLEGLAGFGVARDQLERFLVLLGRIGKAPGTLGLAALGHVLGELRVPHTSSCLDIAWTEAQCLLVGSDGLGISPLFFQ